MVNDVLDISKIEAGEMELHTSHFDVGQMIEETESTIRPLVEQNDNRFEIDCPDDLGMMRTDRTKLRQRLRTLFRSLSHTDQSVPQNVACSRTAGAGVPVSAEAAAPMGLTFRRRLAVSSLLRASSAKVTYVTPRPAPAPSATIMGTDSG